MRTSITMEGFKELDRALGELPSKAAARNTLQRTLKKAAQPVADKWKSLAPVREGKLERSIIVGPNSKLTSRQKKDAKKEGKFFAEIHIGTSDPAGQQQEFGNVNHPAQPSGRPAWEATQDGALADIKNELGAEIEKTAARAAKKRAKLEL